MYVASHTFFECLQKYLKYFMIRLHIMVSNRLCNIIPHGSSGIKTANGLVTARHISIQYRRFRSSSCSNGSTRISMQWCARQCHASPNFVWRHWSSKDRSSTLVQRSDSGVSILCVEYIGDCKTMDRTRIRLLRYVLFTRQCSHNRQILRVYRLSSSDLRNFAVFNSYFQNFYQVVFNAVCT